ncbi:cell division protein ZipA [Serratia marcescens]|nr:cell division protein ZipA [Serratia marcescens]
MKTYPAVLHLMCGKAGAGKSTLAQRLAQQPQTLLLSEDAWLATLYEQEMASLQDYARCSDRLRRALGGHLVQLLRGGWSVALDFPMNTPDRRRWAKALAEEAGVAHCLHFLDVSHAQCLSRITLRNARGEHPFTLSEAEFERLAQYFVPPAEEEGMTVLHYGERD